MFQNVLPNGTTLQDVILWMDGFGPADRRTKAPYDLSRNAAYMPISSGMARSFSPGSYIDVGSDPVGTGDITACVWLYHANIGGDQTGRFFDNGKFVFAMSGTVPNIAVKGSSNGVTFVTSAAAGFATSTWTFVTFTRPAGGANCNFYINGVLSGTANQNSGTPAAGTGNLFLGNDSTGTYPYIGFLVNFLLFKKILTPFQIMQTYRRSV